MTRNLARVDNVNEAVIAEATAFVRDAMRKTTQNIVAIGQIVREMRAALPHGRFTRWVTEDIGIGIDTARRMMHASVLIEQRQQFAAFEPSVVYELAAPSTPESVRDAVLRGEVMPTVADVRAARRAAQEPRIVESVPDESEEDDDTNIWDMLYGAMLHDRAEQLTISEVAKMIALDPTVLPVVRHWSVVFGAAARTAR